MHLKHFADRRLNFPKSRKMADEGLATQRLLSQAWIRKETSHGDSYGSCRAIFFTERERVEEEREI